MSLCDNYKRSRRREASILRIINLRHEDAKDARIAVHEVAWATKLNSLLYSVDLTSLVVNQVHATGAPQAAS